MTPFFKQVSNLDSVALILPPTMPSYSSPVPMGTTGLPELRGVPGGAESRIDPTLRPYLELGLRRGEQLFFGDQQPSVSFQGRRLSLPRQQTLIKPSPLKKH
jgi:hypothetical protein